MLAYTILSLPILCLTGSILYCGIRLYRIVNPKYNRKEKSKTIKTDLRKKLKKAMHSE